MKELFIKADVIHAHDVFFWCFPFKLLYPNKLMFVTFHGYETKFPPDRKAILIRKISELLTDGNICIGEYIKKWYGTKPSKVLYGGVENIKVFYGENKVIKKELRILLIGRLEKDIGISVYLRAIGFLKQKKFKFVFFALGEGSLDKQIKKYGKVKYFSNDIGKAIDKSDIIFSSSYLTMLEGLIRKKIVIAVYDNPLKEDYLRNSPFAKYVYICKDFGEIFRVIESVRNNFWKSSTMIENGYNWAKEQTWGVIAEEYLDLWER